MQWQDKGVLGNHIQGITEAYPAQGRQKMLHPAQGFFWLSLGH